MGIMVAVIVRPQVVRHLPYSRLWMLVFTCALISMANAFTILPARSWTTTSQIQSKASNDHDDNSMLMGRRGALASAGAAFMLGSIPSSANAEESAQKQYVVKALPSGVKIIDLKEGTGPSPSYGQLISVSYKGYVKVGTNAAPTAPEGKATASSTTSSSSSSNSNASTALQTPPMFDQVSRYVIKHGNGRIVAGLDEGIHTMKVGGVRRIIIPPKLGYVDIGLGPVPSSPFARLKLNRLLDEMVASRNGRLIFDVELFHVMDDEADQGYYGDSSLTPEQLSTLRDNLERSQREAKAAGTVKNGVEVIVGDAA